MVVLALIIAQLVRSPVMSAQQQSLCFGCGRSDTVLDFVLRLRTIEKHWLSPCLRHSMYIANVDDVEPCLYGPYW
jgi:uncharacterized protein (DUF111 family)